MDFKEKLIRAYVLRQENRTGNICQVCVDQATQEILYWHKWTSGSYWLITQVSSKEIISFIKKY